MSLNRRAVRLQLSGGRTLQGQVHIAEGQALAEFLHTKRFFLNLTQVQWEDGGDGELLSHLSVRVSQILWVEPLEAPLHLTSALPPDAEARPMELDLEGARLHVRLNLARETRMSDYLDANTSFIPLWSVRVVGQNRVMDRVALNHSAIQAVRELEDTDPRARQRQQHQADANW